MTDPLVTGPYSVEQQDAAVLAVLHETAAKVPPALVAVLREVASVIAESVTPVAPAPSLKSRLMSRVADYEALKPIADVRQYDGAWVSAGLPGVDIKTLFRDKGTGRTTMLVRMQPGARLPAHRHHDDEQCLVLRGDVRWREIVYQEGDFVVMGRESDHPEVHSVDGNLLLIIAGRNEYARALV
jgi:quercetin dioxygenase-like cupin family protein